MLRTCNHIIMNKKHHRVVRLVQMQSKEKRPKLEIYFDILEAIRNEAMNGEVKPTRLQYGSNLSYDKLSRYIDELRVKNMINDPALSITEKGRQFLEDYGKIRVSIKEIGLEYAS